MFKICGINAYATCSIQTITVFTPNDAFHLETCMNYANLTRHWICDQINKNWITKLQNTHFPVFSIILCAYFVRILLQFCLPNHLPMRIPYKEHKKHFIGQIHNLLLDAFILCISVDLTFLCENQINQL